VTETWNSPPSPRRQQSQSRQTRWGMVLTIVFHFYCVHDRSLAWSMARSTCSGHGSVKDSVGRSRGLDMRRCGEAHQVFRVSVVNPVVACWLDPHLRKNLVQHSSNRFFSLIRRSRRVRPGRRFNLAEPRGFVIDDAPGSDQVVAPVLGNVMTETICIPYGQLLGFMAVSCFSLTHPSSAQQYGPRDSAILVEC
jgi:hypothetical protein